jgi:hypothetical protein
MDTFFKTIYLHPIDISRQQFPRMFKMNPSLKRSGFARTAWKAVADEPKKRANVECRALVDRSRTEKKGRFLVTTIVTKNRQVDMMIKGRFLVTKYTVPVKQEKEKPKVTKKGRFLITTTY